MKVVHRQGLGAQKRAEKAEGGKEGPFQTPASKIQEIQK